MRSKWQGQTRRGYLHELVACDLDGNSFSIPWMIRFWLEFRDSPYCKLHYTDETGTRWTFRMKNR